MLLLGYMFSVTEKNVTFLVYSMLPVSLVWTFLIAASVFSNVYYNINKCKIPIL